jgi:hypothetical protein
MKHTPDARIESGSPASGGPCVSFLGVNGLEKACAVEFLGAWQELNNQFYQPIKFREFHLWSLLYIAETASRHSGYVKKLRKCFLTGV